MEIYRFRVLLDTDEDVFRDIEIASDKNLEQLHQTIQKAFGFSGQEMASVFLSNEKWDKGEEIPLMDMGFEDPDEATYRTMKNTTLEQAVSETTKWIYVYDFLRMWCFYTDLVKKLEPDPAQDYPRISLEYGTAPAEDSREVDPLKGLGDLQEGGGENLGDQEQDEGEDLGHRKNGGGENLGDEIGDLFNNL